MESLFAEELTTYLASICMDCKNLCLRPELERAAAVSPNPQFITEHLEYAYR